MKRMLLVPVCGLFLGLLSGCTILVPDETGSSSAPSAAQARLEELPAGCPSAEGFVVPEPLGAGTGEDGAELLLARLSDWANAGTTMVASDPRWIAGASTAGCLEALADAIGRVYGQVLFSREEDETLEELRKAMVGENLGNLRRARAQSQASNAEYWLLGLLGASSSGDGQFLKMRVSVEPGDSTQPRRGEDWIVLLKKQDAVPTLAHVSGFLAQER
ncbi:hypothetical protein [Paeniglutamicibacter sp. NPDC091659]|uniref:hypothetical protein n=1 Tax=Paeniglutamicibacter sp. NPDC091659 TaxID=3364389 RepID=UPI003828FADC